MSNCDDHTHSLFRPCVNGIYITGYLNPGSWTGRRREGALIQYAEIDGFPVCILDSGQWCEREMGHNGPHVLKGALTNV